MDTLTAPARVPVEITREIAPEEGAARVFRLSERVGAGLIELSLAAPFVEGEPVLVRFVPPDGQADIVRVSAHCGGGGRHLAFERLDVLDRDRLKRYVQERLGLPDVG